jgi:hypothetical protein
VKTSLSFTLSGNSASLEEALRRFRRNWSERLCRVTLHEQPVAQIAMWEWNGDPAAMLSTAMGFGVSPDNIGQLMRGERLHYAMVGRVDWQHWSLDEAATTPILTCEIRDFSVRHVNEPAPRLVQRYTQEAIEDISEETRAAIYRGMTEALRRERDRLLYGDDAYRDVLADNRAHLRNRLYVGEFPRQRMEIVFRLHGSRDRREVAIQTLRNEVVCTLVPIRQTRDMVEMRLETDNFHPAHEVLNRAFRGRFNVTPNFEAPPPRLPRNQGRRGIFESEELHLSLEIVSVNGENCHQPYLAPRHGLTEEWAANWLYNAVSTDADRAEIARQREEAEQRANELLKSVIGEEAYKTLLDEWYLHVGSPNCEWRKYAIPLHKDRRILFWDEKGHYELCIAPASDVPAADRVLTHYFMIQGDEEAHLRIANFFDKDGNQIANPYRNTVPSNDLLNLWNDITVDRRERERRRDAGAFTPFIPDDMQVNGEMEADRDGVWQRLRDAVIEDVTPPLETVCDAVATALERLPQSGIFQRILDSRRAPTREFISWDRSIGDDASAIVAGRTDEDGVVHINEITYETVYVPIDRANNSQEE